MNNISLSACIVLYKPRSCVLDTIRSLDESSIDCTLYLVDNTPPERRNAKPVFRRFLHTALHPFLPKHGEASPDAESVTSSEADRVSAAEITAAAPTAHYIPIGRNIGFGRGHNRIIRDLHSTYHLLLNPDVTFEPDLLKRMIEYMEEHPDIAVLSPRVLNLDGTEQFLPRRRPTVRYLLGRYFADKSSRFAAWRAEYTMRDNPPSAPVGVQFATGCFLLIRTNTFIQLEGFDPRFFLYHEDSDLSLRALRCGRVVYHPEMVVTHAWERASAHSITATLHHVVSTVKFFWKWGLKW